MSLTLEQIYALNPSTTINDTDLFYLVQSPYTPGTDSGISGLSLKNLFVTIPGSTSLTTLGTITTGIWHATTIGAIYGGTGLTSYTLGDMLYASAANTLARLAGNTTATKNFLSQTGNGVVSAPPLWTTISASDIGGGQALTKVDDTNVTLTLGGTPATALLQATSLTLGWTGQLSLTRGGTNASLTASNGGIIYSTATEMAVLAGTATAGQILRSGSNAAPSWSTATYPATAGASGNVLISNGTNYISSTSLWPNTVGASGKVVISDGTSNVYSTPTFPNASATSGKFIISDGTNWIASTPTIPNTAGTSGKILVSDGTNFISSTPTFPNASATLNKIIKSDGTNWVASTETYAAPGTSGNVMTSDGTNWTSASASGSLPSGTLFNFQFTTLTTVFTTTSTSFTDITGLSVTITPTSSSNKILVRAVVGVDAASATSAAAFQLVRGSTPIGIGTSVGSRTACTTQSSAPGVSQMASATLEWVDTPATTSATTYKVQILTNVAGTVGVNASSTDTNTAQFPRTVSIISVCEIKA